MKKFMFYSLFLFLATAFAGCGGSGSDEPQPAGVAITVTPEELEVPAEGGTFTVKVATTGKEWGSYVNADFVTLKTENTTSQTGVIHVTVPANPTTDARAATITVMSGAARKAIALVQRAAATQAYYAPEGYKLAWHDEFDGTELSSDWTYEVKPARWVNNEEQEYVRDRRTVEVKDGSLNIHCFKDTDGRIKSGRIYARQTKGWQYGYFEARMLLPKGKGTWPAFWMMPVNFRAWPADGEIDIMEEVGVVPNEVSSSIHCTSYNHNKGTQKTHAMTISKAEGEYHVYALEWTKDHIKTYVDGNPQLTFMNDGKGNKDTWPFDAPFYVIFNLAWGGMWGGMQGVDYSALPVTMQVDYVRVFQK